jgi:hypothetical protein
MVFRKLNYDISKIAKFMGISVRIEHIKNWGVIYWPERIGLVFPTVWSGQDFGQNCD